ncbi:hypothetical protein GSI_01505 [Ganoderma sinense ZZ0214-1]|uniref:LIM zinc-binding domain-containing protein n=1 Tax=Ganoderma sinense ZZ0214-1 TaxID=1077348 RepID=A0A2G8SPZ6_9APHY|nr:hypothetical protein GSI_01505 [Ganoderma sinense ZZ0214-1]
MDESTTEETKKTQTRLTEDRICRKCERSVVDAKEGVVITFGQSVFHISCFKCAKCGNQATAGADLLLLSDGAPICADCSYRCGMCMLPILDEAILTGEESYHTHCFKCRKCERQIEELVFAKTSRGMYCMGCHNERVERGRERRAKKEDEERERDLEYARVLQKQQQQQGAETTALDVRPRL